ncbi:DPP IV N-terminal domain-containing protein, partial [Escherichia coli]|uniref:DPP IV N-terminal domain-containing protein n=1 Tax=Escherichia coli TaxID=562 RepID=UPI0028DEF80E
APRSAPSDLILAPDGSQGVFKRGHDLWLRTVATGEERRLTRDGEADFAYGDYDSYGDVEKVQRRRQRLSEPLVGVVWSPDSRFVLGL